MICEVNSRRCIVNGKYYYTNIGPFTNYFISSLSCTWPGVGEEFVNESKNVFFFHFLLFDLTSHF